MQNFRPLTAYGISLLKNTSSLQLQVVNYLETVLDSFIKGQISQQEATHIFAQTAGNSSPVSHIAQILSVSPTPLSDDHHTNSPDPNGKPKKTRPWSPIEDMRLLAGIHKYGLEAWGTIAKFVGNSRSKAQCAQRWSRGLDPRIAKIHWSPEEDQLLLRSVAKFGVKSWTIVASEIPSRSDVQCRYRYNQLCNEKKLVQSTCCSKAFNLMTPHSSSPAPCYLSTASLTQAPQYIAMFQSSPSINIPALEQEQTRGRIILPSIESFVSPLIV